MNIASASLQNPHLHLKFMKRFLSIILAGIAVMVLIFGPINLRRAEAADVPSGLPSFASCIPGPGDITKCATVISYYLFFVPTAAIFWFGGQLFNAAVAFSLNGKMLSSDMVSTGWSISRDVANLFFIFILLYIAIATILQLSTYGMKSLLAKLVIVALLVNFSLVITKVVIDASNILAYEFYNKMTVPGGSVTTTIFGENARDISAVFVAGFNPEKLFSSASFDQWIKDTSGSSFAMWMLFGITAIMNLVGTFVLMAGGLLFIIRVAVLWIIMILAPLAFLFMVLPKTQEYAKKWRDKLFSQSFFAPAFLFLFYLVAKLVDSGFLKNIFQSATGLSGMNSFYATIFSILISFSVLVVLMICCLIVAQQMGAYGAGMVQGWGKSAAKWGRGQAGKWTGRAARRVAAPLAEKVATGEGRVAKTLRYIPGVALGAAAIAAKQRARVTEVQKGYDKYNSAELKNLITRVMPLNRTAIIQELTKRNALKTEGGLTEGQLGVHRRMMKSNGIDTKDFDRLRPDIIDQSTEGNKWRETRDKALAKANWTEIDKSTVEKIFSEKDNPHIKDDINAIIKGSTSSVAKKLVEEVGGDAEKAFFDSLKKLGTKVEDIADKIASPDIGNYSLASWVRSTPSRPMMIAHGIGSKEEKEEKKKPVFE